MPSTTANKPKKLYGIEIYSPEDVSDPVGHLESDTPFMAFHRGEILNSHNLPGINYSGVMRIINVEHVFWEVGGVIKHRLAVYTEAAPDTAEESSRKFE